MKRPINPVPGSFPPTSQQPSSLATLSGQAGGRAFTFSINAASAGVSVRWFYLLLEKTKESL